jgi:hypothetical protein
MIGADDYVTKPFSPSDWWPGGTPSAPVSLVSDKTQEKSELNPARSY